MVRKRYRRNLRRQHREEIAQLTEKLVAANARAANLQIQWQRALAAESAARAAVLRAEELAFRRFMGATGLMRITLEQVAHAMGRKLGEELRPVAEKIIGASRPVSGIDFSVHADPVRVAARRIQAHIPAITYTFMVTDQELDLYRGL